jgi:ABC-2 type transport system permease protein
LSPTRLWAVCSLDLRHNLKRPLYWIWAIIIFFCALGLSTGGMQIQAGDSATGGTRAHLTSALANGMEITLLGGIFYTFFLAVAAGLEVIRDRETRIEAILHSTPLKLSEYVWGKFGAAMVGTFVMLGLQIVLSMFFKHIITVQEQPELIGDFALFNYLQPALLFSVPMIIFVGGLSFLIGERTRKPVLVNMLPLGLLFLCMFLLWTWSPEWLDPRINQALMCVDPTGFRWLQQTWIEVDRGAEFYNTNLIGYEAPFYLSRLAMVAIGLGAVGYAQSHLSRSMRGARVSSAVASSALEEARSAVSSAARPSIRRRPLAELWMKSERPSFFAALLEVARTEFAIVRRHPGVWLFLPLLVIDSTFGALFTEGPFGTRLMLTPGRSAVGALDELTFSLALLLMFYTVEALRRERGTRLDSILYSHPISTRAVIFGKLLATSTVGVLVLLVEVATFVVILLAQGEVPVSFGPYLYVYGLLLPPTLFFWTALVATIYSLSGNRFVTYAAGLGVMIWTGVSLALGNMSWVWNWSMINALVWTDFGSTAMDGEPLLYNRLMVVGAALFLVALTSRVFPRRKFDSTRIVQRLQPLQLGRVALFLSPWVLLPLVPGIKLQREINAGPQGPAQERMGKDYWRKNMRTWMEVKNPDIAAAEVTVELEPAERWMHSRGTFELVNHHDVDLTRFAMTRGEYWEELSWTLNGEEYEPEDREGLFVFDLPEPLEYGEICTVGWDFESVMLSGYSKNGGRPSEFILESGVVLTSFSASFVPLVGFVEGVGVDEDNNYDSREYPDDFFEGQTHAAFGPNTPFPVRTTITAPEEYAMNGVGVVVGGSSTDGRRTVIWESDEPIRFFNIVGGKWSVVHGDGTALYHLPAHDYNVDEMLLALDGAREHYSAWFHPFPWKELRVSEFAAYAGYAQGFPTNISFSEGIGFLTKNEENANAAFMVTAHEAAHQWWGNILMPGEGPGGNLLSEGMAHFSTALLFEEVKGLEQRISFLTNLEDSYNTSRVVDSERELVKVDGSKDGDTTLTYDKMGWVAWMMLQELGRENTITGLRAFFDEYADSRDHPVLQDFVLHMREYSADKASFDAFVEQWFFEVVLPEYELSEVELGPAQGATGERELSFTITNQGTSQMLVEVAATRGDRFPESVEEGEELEPYRMQSASVWLGAGESQTLKLSCDFEPELLVVDPDALVLQRGRKQALHRF